MQANKELKYYLQLKYSTGDEFPFKVMNISDDIVESKHDVLLKEERIPSGKLLQVYKSGKKIIKGNHDIRIRLPSNEMVIIFATGDVKKVCNN